MAAFNGVTSIYFYTLQKFILIVAAVLAAAHADVSHLSAANSFDGYGYPAPKSGGYEYPKPQIAFEYGYHYPAPKVQLTLPPPTVTTQKSLPIVTYLPPTTAAPPAVS